MSQKEKLILLILLIVAFILRLYFVPVPGYRNEVTNYKIWSQSAAIFGVHNIYDKTWCNIPPVNGYIFKTIGYVYQLFRPISDKDSYLFQFLVKAIPIFSDILISIIIFMFVRKKKSFNISLLAASAYALNPAVILSSAYWGQMDSVAILIALGAVLSLISNRYVWAWALLALALLTNIHFGMLIPIFVLITWKRCGPGKLFNVFVCSWGVFAVVLMPFMVFHQIDRIIDRLFYWTGGYPYISNVAFNFWWPFRGGQENWMFDTDRFLNMVPYRIVGIIYLSVLFILILRYLYYRYKDDNAVLLSAFVAIFSYFILATQMSSRNLIPALAFLLLVAVSERKWGWTYLLISVSALTNTFLALFWAYPKDFPVLPQLFRWIPTDYIICALNTALFIYILYMLTKDVHKKYLAYCFAGLLILLVAVKLPWPAHQIYLSDMTPKIKYQQTGEMKLNDNFVGYLLSVNGYKFKKGIGTQAYSSIEYDLDGRYHFLEGMVGRDDIGVNRNKIEAWIYADKKLVYKSGPIVGWTNPLYFHVDIKGVQMIKLVISDGGDGIAGDNGDWLNIKAIP